MSRIIFQLSLMLMCAGCASLPSAAPTSRQIVKGSNPETGERITVVDINTLPFSKATRMTDRATNEVWPIGDAAPWSGAVARGDTVNITIYEIGYALFSREGVSAATSASAAAAAPSASGINLPPMLVSEQGTVTVPYVGAVQAEGRSAEQIAANIQSRLRGKSQSAQVVVSVGRGIVQSIVISGDVKQPGRFALTPAGERLLDAIAQAGGATGRNADTRVRMTRNGQTAETRLSDLNVESAANVRLATGDTIELIRKARSLTVLGAARTVTEIPFESDQLMLTEALSRAGGPVDERADARGVFVFRFEQVMLDGQPVERPTIYRLDLLNPRSYFSAQRFEMREKDVLLVANARSNDIQKFVQLINQLVTPAVTVDLLTR